MLTIVTLVTTHLPTCEDGRALDSSPIHPGPVSSIIIHFLLVEGDGCVSHLGRSRDDDEVLGIIMIMPHL